jgi:hypothetical protein
MQAPRKAGADNPKHATRQPRANLARWSLRPCKQFDGAPLSANLRWRPFKENDMLRALLILVAIGLLVLIVLTATGMISLTQTQQAQAPAFDVRVKQVQVGTTTKNVEVPTVGMKTKQVEVPTLQVGNGSQGNSH